MAPTKNMCGVMYYMTKLLCAQSVGSLSVVMLHFKCFEVQM